MKALADSTVAIVGIGLMGGSLAAALKSVQACHRLIGIDRDARTRACALERHFVDEADDSLKAAAQADIVVLATPVLTIIDQVHQLASVARKGTMIMDLGSTKRAVVEAMEALPDSIQAIGAHPMCGKETCGLEAADSSLYRDATWALTPLSRTAPDTVALARSLVTAVGARALVLDAEAHDRIVATTSHLPFLVACALMQTLADWAHTDERYFSLVAGGMRDTTRLSASNSTVMMDALETNSENVAQAIDAYSQELARLADLVRRRDKLALGQKLVCSAKARQEVWPHG